MSSVIVTDTTDARRPKNEAVLLRDAQEYHILEALGIRDHRIPKVNDDTLFCYYKYLKRNLIVPFWADDPGQDRCLVIELLDPQNFLGNEFDGLFCKTRKGKYEINLPLIELEVAQNSSNFELIDDFWFWFWNWR
jgi:hypothetical protein